MRRTWIIIFAISGLLLLGCALLVPAHFRAIDAAVIERAGKGAPGANPATLVEEGLNFLSVEKLGPARFLLTAAQTEGVPRSELLNGAVDKFARENPSLVALGGSSPLLEKAELGVERAAEPKPVIELLTRRAVREKAFALLQDSRRPGVQQILKNRTLANTVHFPPATSSSGQAFDAAILTAGLLFQGDYFTATFRDAFEWLAMRANSGDDSSSLELVYLDLVSLGRRLDWISLTEVMRLVPDLATLRDLAQAMRSNEEATPSVFSAVVLSGSASGVAKYLTRFSKTGLQDLNHALRYGRGAVELLIKQQQQVFYGGTRNRVIAYDPFGSVFYGLTPAAMASRFGALVLKYSLMLLGAFLLARAVGFIAVPLGHRVGMRFAADSVMATAIAFVLLVAVEPFLGMPSQEQLSIKLQIPMLASAATAAKLQNITKPIMNQLTIISLVVFFVIQAIVYIWCLAKLAEIRRQPLAPNLKLRLLENEDHLFDAGLYIGFVGTIISLVLIAIGVVRTPSAMVAYSSTSFGVIFVSVLKIFHVRPLRRKLILETESQS
jgi:hypothetical protein